MKSTKAKTEEPRCMGSALNDLLSVNSDLRKQVEELQERRNRIYQDMLSWRGIDIEMGDIPCPWCGGAGLRSYGDTTTWRDGIGGQMITSDVCDKCWGSGNAKKPWTNLKRLAR